MPDANDSKIVTNELVTRIYHTGRGTSYLKPARGVVIITVRPDADGLGIAIQNEHGTHIGGVVIDAWNNKLKVCCWDGTNAEAGKDPDHVHVITDKLNEELEREPAPAG